MRVDTRRIECFVAVAEHLSCRPLVHRPTLSSAEIRKLDADLGYQLFNRRTRP